jgi:GNAT superfamily N-acetyltransferase
VDHGSAVEPNHGSAAEPDHGSAAEPDHGSLRVRAAVPTDAAAVARLLGELGYPTAAEDVPRRLSALAGEENAVFVAVDAADAGEAADAADTVLGLVAVHREPALHHPAPACLITALVTSSQARRRGVGRRLLSAAEEWARERGCSRIVVTSAERRADAHAFYPRCGYPYTGRRFGRSLT